MSSSTGTTPSERETVLTATNIFQENAKFLPQPLRSAQAAIHLPEVQEMLRKLSEYNLGIFMPHMHDERAGNFQPLPDDLMQVESGLEVTFRPAEKIASQAEHFLPVAWSWRAGAPMPIAACEMVREERLGDTECVVKHKMNAS